MGRQVLVLLVLVKCCAAVADYGEADYGEGDYGDDGYYLEGSTKGDSGYNYGDSYNKRDKDGYGFESHSQYGNNDGGDGENGSYESSYAYNQEDKPKSTSYQYSSSSGTPYEGDDYDDDGSYEGSRDVLNRRVESPSRAYKALYDSPGVYDTSDTPGAYSSSSHTAVDNLYQQAADALRDVELLSKLAGPKYRQFFDGSE